MPGTTGEILRFMSIPIGQIATNTSLVNIRTELLHNPANPFQTFSILEQRGTRPSQLHTSIHDLFCNIFLNQTSGTQLLFHFITLNKLNKVVMILYVLQRTITA